MILSYLKQEFISFRPDKYSDFSKYKKIIWNILFATLLLSIFLTIFFQIPALSEKSINHIADLIWVIDLVLLILFDYKVFIKSLIKISFIAGPFVLYLVLALCLKQPAFTGSPLTKSIFLSLFIVLIWLSYSPLFKKSNLKAFMLVYIVSAILLSAVVYFDVLRGANISSSIYAYKSKNSTGPILFIAIIFSYFLLSNKKVYLTVIKYVLYVFFVVIIALMKCRTVLIFLPIAFLYLFRLQFKSDTAFVILIVSSAVIVILLFAVPYLRNTILFNILLNGKQNATIDDVFSGRLSIIYQKLISNNNYLIGNFSTYFDCLPLLLIVNYGVFGVLLFAPIIIFPFYLYQKSKLLYGKKDWFVNLQLLILISFSFFSVFEGLVPFGPGAETFVFWMVLCCNYVRQDKLASKVETNLYRAFDKVERIFNKQTLVTLMSLTLYGFLLLFIASASVFQSFSSYIFDVLPWEKTSISYTAPSSVIVDGPSQMCVGQKMVYHSKFNPDNTTDKGTRWDTWAQNGELIIDEFDGVATALKEGQNISIIGKSSKAYSIYGRKMISIVKPNDFNFADFKIASEDDDKSFYSKGETTKIIYDSNYVPTIDLIEFHSSNESVASISSDGVVSFVNAGHVEIYATINNSFHNKSNLLVFDVDDLGFVPTTQIDFDAPSQYNQFEPLNISVKFNEYASDKHFDLIITGGEYHIDSNFTITFLNYGVYQIKALSRNNKELEVSKIVEVLANPISSIEYYGTEWLEVGEMEKLDLRIKYKSGFERKLLPSDIVTTNNDFNNRAWMSKNGICADELSVIAITSGNISLNFSLKSNPKINISINIVCNKYSYAKYCSLLYSVGGVVSSIVAFMFLIFSLINGLRINKIIIISSYSLLYWLAMFLLIFIRGSSMFLIIPFGALYLIYLTIICFTFIKRKTISFDIFCESIMVNNIPNKKDLVFHYKELKI